MSGHVIRCRCVCVCVVVCQCMLVYVIVCHCMLLYVSVSVYVSVCRCMSVYFSLCMSLYGIVCQCVLVYDSIAMSLYVMKWYVNLHHHDLYNDFVKTCLPLFFPLQGLSLSKFPRFPHQFHEELVIFYCQRHLINRSILPSLVDLNSCNKSSHFCR